MRVKCDRCDMVMEHQKNLEEKLRVASEYIEKVLELRELRNGCRIEEGLIQEIYFGEHSKEALSKLKGGK